MKKHKKFTPQERELLANYLASGKSKRECGRLLSRPLKTIKAEIKRNGSRVRDQCGKFIFIYVAISAQAKAERRQQNSVNNKQPLKNPKVYRYVTKHLRKGWSPEAIAGRLRKKHPDDDSWHICHETIYEWIFDQVGKDKDTGFYWYEYLRRKQKRRKTQKGRSVHQSHIPDRVSISQRPEVINNREEFGHWEGDSIEGRRQDGSGLHTEVERMSRKIKAVKVSAITSQEAILAQEKIFIKVPTPARKSTTLDNGRENHLHVKLRESLGMKTYHAHPYSSFERGTNEHANWLLRYYFPKGTDFSTVTDKELRSVVRELNNRPRKILGFQTANEVYYQLLKQERGDDRN